MGNRRSSKLSRYHSEIEKLIVVKVRDKTKSWNWAASRLRSKPGLEMLHTSTLWRYAMRRFPLLFQKLQ